VAVKMDLASAAPAFSKEPGGWWGCGLVVLALAGTGGEREPGGCAVGVGSGSGITGTVFLGVVDYVEEGVAALGRSLDGLGVVTILEDLALSAPVAINPDYS